MSVYTHSHTTSAHTRDAPPSLSKLNIHSVPISLDEPTAQGITIQPPTASLEDHADPEPPNQPFISTAPAPDPAAVPHQATFCSISQAPFSETHLNRSPASGTGSNLISPSTRHPLTRQLSPDLPTRDALYLFSNFASYMRSPHEGAEGIVSNEDFKDTVRLLEFARVG